MYEETNRRISVRRQGGEPFTRQDLLRECEKKINKELSKEDIKKLESTVYASANRFLNPTELGKVEEVLKLSLLGQMILEDGIETGMEKSVAKIVTTMLRKNKTAEEIHEDTGVPIKQILKVKESLDSHSSKR